MSTKQILSFYDVMKAMIANSLKEGDFITLNKTYLEFYNLSVRTSQNGIFTSAIGYYPGSLDAIIKLMKVNLELESHEMTKTFSFNANEEYEVQPTGKGIYSGDKLQTIPRFIGKKVSTAEDWATKHNIKLNIEYVDSNSPHYNNEVKANQIANQSVNNGILINTISELTIYVNKTTPVIPDNPPQDNNQEGNNDNNQNTDPTPTDPNTQEPTNEETNNNPSEENNTNTDETEESSE